MPFDSAFGVLLGGDPNRHLAHLAEFIGQQPSEVSHRDGVTCADYPKMVDILRGCPSWEDVAKGIVAMVALNPNHPDRPLRAATAILSSRYQIACTSDYVLGTVLGLFEAAVWLDESWRDPDALCRTLRGLVNGFLDSQMLDRPMFSLGEEEDLPDTQYNDRLSQAIKKYVRGGMPGLRLVTVSEIVQCARDTFEVHGAHIPYLSGVVLDQICYGWFGNISTIGRIRALDELTLSLLPQTDAPTGV